MYRFLLPICLLLLCLSALPVAAQIPTGFRRQGLLIRDSTGIFTASQQEGLFYYAQRPVGSIRGVLVMFLPNGGDPAEAITTNSKLIALGRDSGLLVVIPSINHNLFLDTASFGFINAVMRSVLKEYRPASGSFILGGFSLGGMNAIRYTEIAYEDSSRTAIRPAAVYGIDPPLDLSRLYGSFTRAVQKAFSQPAVAEASYFLYRMKAGFGGTPAEVPAVYERHSMYSRAAPEGGNARFLRTVPVRIYSDPDIDWQLTNRRVDFYDMNALDGSALINQLHLDGNTRAEYINALGKGYRPDGTRHPHSWSLADPGDTIRWMLRCLNGKP
jgi:hypothetical protein